MQYTIINNFAEAGSYEGIPGSDERGSYILFSLELADVMTPSMFLKATDGSMVQIKENDYHRENGKITKLKAYY